LSRVPVPRDWWNAIGVFRHGEMRDPAYTRRVFNAHFAVAEPRLPSAFTVLELGPGDSLGTAPLAISAGASHVYFVDRGPFAAAPEMVLSRYPVTYLTDGIRSLRGLADGCSDWLFSHAVLEHVGLDEFGATVRELFRIQSAGSTSSHQIDFQDHLGHSLHSLRFPRRVWESALFRESGFYTNRLRPSQMRRHFVDAGFRIASWQDECWPAVPLARARLDAEFASLSDRDLTVRSSFVVLAKP
jgi:methyltransferase family protein